MGRVRYALTAGRLVVVLCGTAWAQTPSEPVAVILEGRTLFSIQTSLGPFTAQERAAQLASALLVPPRT